MRAVWGCEGSRAIMSAHVTSALPTAWGADEHCVRLRAGRWFATPGGVNADLSLAPLSRAHMHTHTHAYPYMHTSCAIMQALISSAGGQCRFGTLQERHSNKSLDATNPRDFARMVSMQVLKHGLARCELWLLGACSMLDGQEAPFISNAWPATPAGRGLPVGTDALNHTHSLHDCNLHWH